MAEPEPEVIPDQNNDIIVIHNDEHLDDEVLRVLGEDKVTPSSYELHSILQKRWSSIISQGLEKEERMDLLSKHLVPVNLQMLNAPEVNPEILSALPETAVKKDKYHVTRQVQLGKGISALGAALNVLLQQTSREPALVNEVLKPLSEGAKILTDLHYRLSLSRKAMITPFVNKSLRELCTKAPIGALLFGPNLGEKIKTAKALVQSGRNLKQSESIIRKKPYVSGRPLNYRSLPRYSREARQAQPSPYPQRHKTYRRQSQV